MKDKNKAAALMQEDGFIDELRQEMRFRLFNEWCKAATVDEREAVWDQQKAIELAINRVVAWANEYKREAIHVDA